LKFKKGVFTAAEDVIITAALKGYKEVRAQAVHFRIVPPSFADDCLLLLYSSRLTDSPTRTSWRLSSRREEGREPFILPSSWKSVRSFPLATLRVPFIELTVSVLSFPAKALPDRPIIAVYHHLRRLFHPLKGQGHWSKEEDENLKA